MFRVKCKDERKRRNDRLGEGGSIFPYIKNTKVFLENLPIFSENTKVFLKNTKVFLQQESVSKRNRPIPSSAVGAGFACPKTQSKLFSGEQTSPLLLLDNRCQRMPVSFYLFQECLGRAKVQIKVQTHG